jgi:dolichol-phosphate mannosyltransferase
MAGASGQMARIDMLNTHAGRSAEGAVGYRKLSVVVPAFNEEKSLPVLCERLLEVLDVLNAPFEIILVNDGSTDGTRAAIRAAAERRGEIKAIELKRNYGQTAALLLAKIAEGYDVVSGWRKDRKDSELRRNLPSRVANWIISKVSQVKLHDYGCTLKAYRRDVLDGVRLYGEMHRLIPVYASWMGARVTEIPVRHHPRKHGQSHYGLERVVKIILDLIVVKFMDRQFMKPIYVFGGFGMLCLAISFLAGAWALFLKFVDGLSLIQTPLPLLAVMTFVTGVMCILMGLISEILMRT